MARKTPATAQALTSKTLAALMLAALGGCATGISEDPIDRPGSWRASGVNDHNLAAMVATPSHLERGIGASTERAQPGSLGVTRLVTDRRRKLPVTTASSVGASQQQTQDAPVTGTGNGGGGGAGR